MYIVHAHMHALNVSGWETVTSGVLQGSIGARADTIPRYNNDIDDGITSPR